MKQSTKKLLALLTAGMLCTGSLGFLPASAETAGETDENNTIETAEAIEVNTEVTGNLATEDDVDYYRLDLAENSLLELSFQHKDLNNSGRYWKITIADSDGTTLQEWDNNGSQTVYKTPQMGFGAGTYYLIVEGDGFRYSDVNYTMTVTANTTGSFETERNNTLEDASEILLNTPCVGNLYKDGDIDYYKLTLTEDSLLELNFAHKDLNSSSTCWKYSIADDEGTILQTWNNEGSDINQKTPKMGFGEGTYYIIVEGISLFYSDINYTLTVNSDNAGSFETEKNDAVEDASEIALNTPFVGNLYRERDVDYYKLTLTEDSMLELNFQHKDLNSSSRYWKFSIADSDGTTLQTWDNDGSDTNQKTPKMGFEKGIYYLLVESDGFYYSDINYTITVNSSTSGNFETEKNDLIENADAVPVATACTGNLYRERDVDYYSFTLENTSNVSIMFQHVDLNSSSTYWEYSLLDENGKEFFIQDSKGTDVKITSDSTKLDAGTYYVKVTSDSFYHSDANYTLTINADEITYLKGDVNGDGAVNAMDVSALLVSSARQAVGYTEGVLTGENALAADVNEDGEINAMDASYILTYSAKIGAGLDADWDSLIGK